VAEICVWVQRVRLLLRSCFRSLTLVRCSGRLLFNPIIEWWRKGPISRQIHRFLWSGAPLHYKISMLSCAFPLLLLSLSLKADMATHSSSPDMFSYYGIAGSITIGLINYVLLGFQFEVDGYFMHAFEIWLATTVVFWGSGTIGYTLLEYRLGRRSLVSAPLLFSSGTRVRGMRIADSGNGEGRGAEARSVGAGVGHARRAFPRRCMSRRRTPLTSTSSRFFQSNFSYFPSPSPPALLILPMAPRGIHSHARLGCTSFDSQCSFADSKLLADTNNRL